MLSTLKTFFTTSTDRILMQFFRYTFVGGFAFFVDFSVLTGLTFFILFKRFYLFAAAISFILGLTTNYFLSVRWVFNRRNIENRTVEFLLFAGVGVMGLIMNLVFIWLFTEFLFLTVLTVHDKQLRILSSKFIAAWFVLLWNFITRKLILFK